jgi:hypothetical protein
MSKALSGKTVARFFQIENKMDIIVEYEMAASPHMGPEGPRTPC